MSNIKKYKYDWYWQKPQGTNFLNSSFQPMKVVESIHVFSDMASSYSKKGTMSYFPIKTIGKPYKATSSTGRFKFNSCPAGNVTINKGDRFPINVLKFATDKGKHATQKPVALLEYLIKTYTLEGETVLDFTMGSGSTGVACKNLGRKFIGIEKDDKYFEIARQRING